MAVTAVAVSFGGVFWYDFLRSSSPASAAEGLRPFVPPTVTPD